ncbi:MAG: ABC transporter substrate-binding protein [Myxococcota bacterium]
MKLALMAATLGALSGCNVLTSLEDCRVDSDCPLQQVCGDGNFCQTDQTAYFIPSFFPNAAFEDLRPDFEAATAIAVDLINENGGVAGRPVRTELIEDRPEETHRMGLEQVSAQRIPGLVGGSSVEPARLQQEFAAREQFLAIDTVSEDPELTTLQPPTDRWFFRLTPPADRSSAAALAMHLAATRPCGSLVTISDERRFAQAYTNSFIRSFEKTGGCVSAQVDVSRGALTYTDAVQVLIDERPECALISAGSQTNGPTILREFATAIQGQDWSDFTLLGGGNFAQDDVEFLLRSRIDPEQPTPSSAEGMLISLAAIDPTRVATRFFRERFRERRGLAPDAPVSSATEEYFDGIMLVALSIARAGGDRDRVLLRDSFWDITDVGGGRVAYSAADYPSLINELLAGQPVHYIGASGDMEFSELGITSRPSTVFQVQDGALVDVARFESAETVEFADGPGTPNPACPPTTRIDLIVE